MHITEFNIYWPLQSCLLLNAIFVHLFFIAANHSTPISCFGFNVPRNTLFEKLDFSPHPDLSTSPFHDYISTQMLHCCNCKHCICICTTCICNTIYHYAPTLQKVGQKTKDKGQRTKDKRQKTKDKRQFK